MARYIFQLWERRLSDTGAANEHSRNLPQTDSQYNLSPTAPQARILALQSHRGHGPLLPETQGIARFNTQSAHCPHQPAR